MFGKFALQIVQYLYFINVTTTQISSHFKVTTIKWSPRQRNVRISVRCHVESNFPINRVLLLGVLFYSAICSNGLSTQILLTSFQVLYEATDFNMQWSRVHSHKLICSNLNANFIKRSFSSSPLLNYLVLQSHFPVFKEILFARNKTGE